MDTELLCATGLHPQALARQARRLLAGADTPWLNALLAERMAERLQWIKAEVRQAWLWQGLWGGGAAALRARYPKAALVALEDRAAPLLQARKAWWRKADWRAPEAAEPEQAQLVWAPLGLLATPDPRALLARWHALLEEQGFLMVSSFGPDSFVELRQLYAREGFGELAPHWVDLHDLGDQLVEAGFAEPVMDQERLRLTWTTPEALWQDLARLGGNLHAARFAGLRTPRWKARWLQAVDRSLRGADGRIGLTLEFVCGHAIKPAPRLPVQQGETRIGLDALRRQLQRRGA